MYSWIGRPPAKRDDAIIDIDDMVGLVKNASEISTSILHTLLQAQVDLITKTGRDAIANPATKQQLADLVTQSLCILVREAENVPGNTGEALAKTRLLLEAVQMPRDYEQEWYEQEYAEPVAEDYMAEDEDIPVPPAQIAEPSFDWHPPQPAAEPARYIEPAQPDISAQFSGLSLETREDGPITDSELVAFVVDKVALGTTAFKANKLPQILAALVREEYMQSAVAATRKALDPNLSGHIQVAAFVDWWPTSKFATPACENNWMKELNAEALRTRLMADALHRQAEAQQAAEAAHAAEVERQRKVAERQASQPKRVQQVLARLRRAEAAMQEAHSAALREALIVVEELADVQPSFLHQLHTQLAETSPFMTIARGGSFPQLVHHKARTQVLVEDIEAASSAELAAREASASRIDNYAVRAESMHRRLHNRSASQAAEWLRVGMKRATDQGNKVQARHLVDNETRKVKIALELMFAWLDGDARKRIADLPARFDALAKRALNHATAAQMPQIAGAGRHRRSTARELSAHLSRELDSKHSSEIEGLHTAMERLSEGLQARENMPIDEHTQLLCAELWFKQRQQLASLHALEHAAIPSVVRTFVDTLSGPSPLEDSSVARMRVSAADLRAAESFAATMHSQAALAQQLDGLHACLAPARQGLTTMANQIQSSGGEKNEGMKATLVSLWKSVQKLSKKAGLVRQAIGEAVDVTAQHLHDFEKRELPRASAMLEAATSIGQAAAIIVGILSGELKPSGEMMTLAPAASAPSGANAPSAAADEDVERPPPDLGPVVDRWGPTAVSIQAEQQRLVAAAADMEQHSLDMQGLMLEIAEPVEIAMGRFVGLVHPGRDLPRKVDFAALSKACKAFEGSFDELIQRALAPLALPEVFARMHGQLQQQKDSVNAWCYPLLKIKTELDLAEQSGSGSGTNSPLVPIKGAKAKDASPPSARGPTGKPLPGKGPPDPKGPAIRPPKGPGKSGPTPPASNRPGSRLGVDAAEVPRQPAVPQALSPANAPASGYAPAGSTLPQSLPLPPSPSKRAYWALGGPPKAELLDPGIVSRVSLDLMKTLLGSAEVKTGQKLTHESLNRRHQQAIQVVDKRKLEQQRYLAEVQALEQLLELSTVAGGKGVPEERLEERMKMLSEAVSAAEALGPRDEEKAAKKAAPDVVVKGGPKKAAKPAAAPAMADPYAMAAMPQMGKPKMDMGGATGGGKKGKKSSPDKDGGAKKKKGKREETKSAARMEEEAQDEAATKIQGAFRGHVIRRPMKIKRKAATRIQSVYRGKKQRRKTPFSFGGAPTGSEKPTGGVPAQAKKKKVGAKKGGDVKTIKATPDKAGGAKKKEAGSTGKPAKAGAGEKKAAPAKAKAK